jgi:hypothetical protein
MNIHFQTSSLRVLLRSWLVCTLLLAMLPTSTTAKPTSIQKPVLKWQNGGCYSSWCETGWYSSPAVADLDGDGTMEVIASAYSVVILDGATGKLEKRIEHDGSRTWAGIVLADLDGDGNLEIVTAVDMCYASITQGMWIGCNTRRATSFAPWRWATWTQMAIWKLWLGRRDWITSTPGCWRTTAISVQAGRS